jgi:hypothetical protein
LSELLDDVSLTSISSVRVPVEVITI